MSDKLSIGYGREEIEPKIAPLVDAVRQAGFVTFSSCEGHIEDHGLQIPRLGSVGFYANEARARSVHRHWLNCRNQLLCSWVLRGGFVVDRQTGQFVLGWTIENGGLKEGGSKSFVKDSVEAAWNTDIPLLADMFSSMDGREN
jgi:hypothetical protein